MKRNNGLLKVFSVLLSVVFAVSTLDVAAVEAQAKPNKEWEIEKEDTLVDLASVQAVATPATAPQIACGRSSFEPVIVIIDEDGVPLAVRPDRADLVAIADEDVPLADTVLSDVAKSPKMGNDNGAAFAGLIASLAGIVAVLLSKKKK